MQHTAQDTNLTARAFKEALDAYADVGDAQFLQRYFKTGPGEYGEGDIFIGVRVPKTRKVCGAFKSMPLQEVQILLESPIHEHRLAAVLILANQFVRAASEKQHEIFAMYIENVKRGSVNNWDIIDSSAPAIVGGWLTGKPKDVVFELASDKSLWCRRVAVLSTFYDIKRGDATTAFVLAGRLIDDPQDLLHKAIGWMLREIGNNNMLELEKAFLDEHAATMPRTMLRYAIEHFTPAERTHYLSLRSLKGTA